MRTGIRQTAAVASVAALLTMPVVARQAPLTVTVRTAKPRIECLDTVQDARAHLNRIRTLDVEAGRALAYDQQPPVVSPNYAGTIQLAEFTVAGDVPALQFVGVDGVAETWARQRMDTLAGAPVSVFQPGWDASILDRAMRYARWGWDQPELYIGDVIGAGALGTNRNILLRIAPLNIPDVRVIQAAPDVQYSSHVVNIVLPGFTDELVQENNATVELSRVTTRFYQLFQDTYDAVAVVPQRSILMPYSAAHYSVRSDVAGIGQDVYDYEIPYGSAGRLHGVEIFPQYFADNHTSSHEASHQWGSYVDWTALTGLVRAGHQPGAHDPMWLDAPSRMSAVLEGQRTVVSAGGAYVVAKSAAPIPFTPLQKYAMGILPKASVPDFVLFDEQGQFSAASSALPDPGTPVAGGVRSTNITAVAGLLGERSGPVPAEWSRATIVVSRGALLSQREMNYWTFYAQRSEDPNRSGIVDFNGFGSFDLASGNVVDFKTDIRPLAGEKIAGPLEVNSPRFGTLDIRGLQLTAPLATVWSAAAPITFAGRVTVANRAGFDRVAFCLSEEDEGGCGRMAPVVSALAGDGSFSASVRPPSAGRYQMLMFLVPVGGGSLAASFQLSTFTVN